MPNLQSYTPLLFTVLLAACNHSDPDHYRPTFTNAVAGKHELIFGTPSLAYYETTDLVVKYLNAHLDSIKVRTVACSSIEDYEDKLRKGYFDFTVINGPQLLTASRHGYSVVGRIADDYRSLIFANKDSGINDFADCKDKTMALTANRILAGSVMPLIFLHDQGVDVNNHLKKLYSPSYESVLLDVCLGKCAIGAVWTTSFGNFQRKRPDLASRLQVKWTTPSLASSAVLFRQDLDKDVAKNILSLLLNLDKDDQGQEALQRVGIGRLIAADSTAYYPLKQFLRKYDSLIH
jgi:phosphonate transport system substrate-binding protein